jgi:apolipoprotein N-acyltransferase
VADPGRGRWGSRIALASAAGALVAAGYSPLALDAFGWIALVPLLLATDGATPATAAVLGWCAGTAAGLGVCGAWIWRAAMEYFGLDAARAGAVTFAIVEVFVAPYFAAFGALASVLQRGGRRCAMLIPAAFVSCELARVLIGGNSWALLGHSQRSPVLVQIASVTGAYGLSFLLALSAVIAVELLRVRRCAAGSAGRVAAMLSAGLVGALALVGAFGAWRLRHPPAATGLLRIGIVQANLANAVRSGAEHASAVMDRYVALSESIQPPPPLVVWPENAIPIFPDDNARLTAPIRLYAAQARAAVLAGAPRAEPIASAAAIYNAAYLFTAAGERPVYDKRRLLPFVERLRLRRGDPAYVPGDAAEPLAVGPARLGILICYEVTDAALGASWAARGANALVNLSNDSWFDTGAGPAQHYELARFRAIESGMALVRVTNSGISGAFDATGRDLVRLPDHTSAAAAVDLPLMPQASFYARYGEWFAFACVAATVAGVLLAHWRSANGDRIGSAFAVRPARRGRTSPGGSATCPAKFRGDAPRRSDCRPPPAVPG